MKEPYPCKCGFCDEIIEDDESYIVHLYCYHPKENKEISEMLNQGA